MGKMYDRMAVYADEGVKWMKVRKWRPLDKKYGEPKILDVGI